MGRVIGFIMVPVCLCACGCVPHGELVRPSLLNTTDRAVELAFRTNASRERGMVRAVLPPGGIFKHEQIFISPPHPSNRPTAVVSVRGARNADAGCSITFSAESGAFEIRRRRDVLEAVPLPGAHQP